MNNVYISRQQLNIIYLQATRGMKEQPDYKTVNEGEGWWRTLYISIL